MNPAVAMMFFAAGALVPTVVLAIALRQNSKLMDRFMARDFRQYVDGEVERSEAATEKPTPERQGAVQHGGTVTGPRFPA